MESTLLHSSSLLSLSKTLRSSSSSSSTASTAIFSLLHYRRLSSSTSSPFPHLTRRLLARQLVSVHFSNAASIRRFCGPVRCVSAGGGGGGGEIGGGGGGGGGDGSDGGVPKVVATSDEVSALSPDAIILDVTGMTCGGCASKVKKILENQPQVSSASVNLATETAIVWPVSEAKAVPNWRQELGEMLAKHLTNCGFESNLQGEGDKEGDTP